MRRGRLELSFGFGSVSFSSFFCDVIDLISDFISHKIVVTPLPVSPLFSFISRLIFSFIKVVTSSSHSFMDQTE